MKKISLFVLAVALISSSAYAKSIKVGCKEANAFPDGNDPVVMKINTISLASITLVKDEENHKNLNLQRDESKDKAITLSIGHHDMFAFVGNGVTLYVEGRMFTPGNPGAGTIKLNDSEYSCTEGGFSAY